MPKQWRTLNAILAIWSELPDLCGDRWPVLEPRLWDLVGRLQKAEGEEEAACVGVDLQDLLEAEAPQALRRFLQVRRQMEEGESRGFQPLFNPWELIPANTVMVCPVDPEGCERKVLRTVGQRLRCEVHNVDLIPVPADLWEEKPPDDDEVLGTAG